MELIQGADHAYRASVEQMSVEHGGAHTGTPVEFLDGPDIGASIPFRPRWNNTTQQDLPR